jgi:hypothetical protein
VSDNIILLSGIFCFSLALIGMVLTVLEFRRMGNAGSVARSRDPVRGVAVAAART